MELEAIMHRLTIIAFVIALLGSATDISKSHAQSSPCAQNPAYCR